MDNIIIAKRDDLCIGLTAALENIPVEISVENNTVLVKFQDILICGTEVMEETYRIFHVSDDWKNKTTYLCEKAEDGTWFYYLETIDECIGEIQRMVMFEAKKTSSTPPQIKDYGNFATGFRYNAADWFDLKKKEGLISKILSKRGNSRQIIITPALDEILERLDLGKMVRDNTHKILYEIEIKEVKGKGTASFRFLAVQDDKTPQKLLKYYEKDLMAKMGRIYDPKMTYPILSLNRINLQRSMTGKDIYNFLDEGFANAEKFEKRLLESSYWTTMK